MSHNHYEEKCFNLITTLKTKIKKDNGFSGYLHAITGVLLVSVFFLVMVITGWGNLYISISYLGLIIAFALAWIGATLYPDLDNSRSTSHSALGLVGTGLSFVARGSSVIVQTVVRTSRDESSPNPHRGFWHTPFSTILVGLGVWALTLLPQQIPLAILGTVTLGQIFATIILAVMILFLLTALVANKMRKIRKMAIGGELIAFAIALVVAIALMYFIPSNLGYAWLGVAIAAGGTTHIIGDTFTKDGPPFWFPLTGFVKKKFWWKTRFARLTSGAKEVEKTISIACTVLSVIIIAITIFLAVTQG